MAKFCGHCGSPLDEQSGVCPACTPQASPLKTEKPAPTRTYATPPKIVWVLLGIMALAAGLIVVLMWQMKRVDEALPLYPVTLTVTTADGEPMEEFSLSVSGTPEGQSDPFFADYTSAQIREDGLYLPKGEFLLSVTDSVSGQTVSQTMYVDPLADTAVECALPSPSGENVVVDEELPAEEVTVPVDPMGDIPVMEEWVGATVQEFIDAHGGSYVQTDYWVAGSMKGVACDNDEYNMIVYYLDDEHDSVFYPGQKIYCVGCSLVDENRPVIVEGDAYLHDTYEEIVSKRTGELFELMDVTGTAFSYTTANGLYVQYCWEYQVQGSPDWVEISGGQNVNDYK